MKIIQTEEEIIKRTAQTLKVSEKLVEKVYEVSIEEMRKFLNNPVNTQIKIPYIGRLEIDIKALRRRIYEMIRKLRKEKKASLPYSDVNLKRFYYYWRIYKMLLSLIHRKYEHNRLKRQLRRAQGIKIDYSKRTLYQERRDKRDRPSEAYYDRDKILGVPSHLREKDGDTIPPYATIPDVYTTYFQAGRENPLSWDTEGVEINSPNKTD
jgi:small-conductance mechanosensitive channel